YQWCETVTECLITFILVFEPWAFGTTQTWSIWTVNICSYALGLILAGKWFIRWQTGFRPPRWGTEAPMLGNRLSGGDSSRRLVAALAILSVLILSYCLTSAINARATLISGANRFEYHDPISWLPHSYDSASTWAAFWNYLGLALYFWGLYDWLVTKTQGELD